MDLANKYRPKSFEDVIGNEDNVLILENFLKSKNIPHTYLFIGEYGTGKTTLARIMANRLKCNDMDIVEINSANNRGIDTARNIIENCQFMPLNGNVKVYILDEVHRWTKDFMEAMLKVLEEPPTHVYFMLCTTESEKIIKTLKSRCTKIVVNKSSVREIRAMLSSICVKENKQIDKKILRQIARKSDGHPRTSLKLLEKIFDINDEEKIVKIINENIIDEENVEMIELCRKIYKKCDWMDIRQILKSVNNDNVESIRRLILSYFTTILLNSNSSNERNRCALIIEDFKNNFYDSGKAGLIQAVFASLHL